MSGRGDSSIARKTKASPHFGPNEENSSRMCYSSSSSSSSPASGAVFSVFIVFLCFASFHTNLVLSDHHDTSISVRNQTLRPDIELQKLRRISSYLKKTNKPAIKTIQSPDGDVIDCVLSHLQPAFDHPELKGRKPLEPPPRPRSNETMEMEVETLQLWKLNGESCPEDSVPIRRITAKDVLRANSIEMFGRKLKKPIRRDSEGGGHEHAVVFVNGDQYYGAKASMNVWTPSVTTPYEFSLSQMWVISGSFGHDLNTIEAGWQVSPELYGDGHPRFFTYWTTDAYQATGCYNLLCSGFVQTNNKIAIGAAISPLSSYSGRQFDIGLMVWKDPKHGHWWLELSNGLLVGYWPAFLFSHLRSHASMVQFGGEVVNSQSTGTHTSTQMGSGRFAEEGFGRAAYFRNLQVVDWDNNLLPLSNLHVLADHPNCYDIRQGVNSIWGRHFYYGGPGKNSRCP